MLAFLFPCPGRYPEGERGARPRHASPAPSVRLAAGTLQEEHPARAGLAHHHHRGHRCDGVRHPQRGESAAPTAPPPGGGVTLCQPCALFFPQDEKNQVLTTYIWYRQVSRGDLCQFPSLWALAAAPEAGALVVTGLAASQQDTIVLEELTGEGRLLSPSPDVCLP